MITETYRVGSLYLQVQGDEWTDQPTAVLFPYVPNAAVTRAMMLDADTLEAIAMDGLLSDEQAARLAQLADDEADSARAIYARTMHRDDFHQIEAWEAAAEACRAA